MRRSSHAPGIVFSVTAVLALGASAAYARPNHKEDPVPQAVSVPEGNKLKLSLVGSGIQRYECAAVNGSYSWKFIAPEAQLFDRRERPAGQHGAGPFWQALDGSQVTAVKRAEASVSETSIPWLLLEATGHAGSGVLDDITYIQRVDTEGGLAPDATCSEANGGEHVDVPYRALYRFYKAAQC
jgi:Protein of unknown function (DUF3455)